MVPLVELAGIERLLAALLHAASAKKAAVAAGVGVAERPVASGWGSAARALAESGACTVTTAERMPTVALRTGVVKTSCVGGEAHGLPAQEGSAQPASLLQSWSPRSRQT